MRLRIADFFVRSYVFRTFLKILKGGSGSHNEVQEIPLPDLNMWIDTSVSKIMVNFTSDSSAVRFFLIKLSGKYGMFIMAFSNTVVLRF